MSEDELAELDEVRLELDIPRQYVSDEVGTALDGALARFDAVRAHLRGQEPEPGEAEEMARGNAVEKVLRESFPTADPDLIVGTADVIVSRLRAHPDSSQGERTGLRERIARTIYESWDPLSGSWEDETEISAEEFYATADEVLTLLPGEGT